MTVLKEGCRGVLGPRHRPWPPEEAHKGGMKWAKKEEPQEARRGCESCRAPAPLAAAPRLRSF